MKWFNGTYDYTEEELEKEFPVSVAHGLRTSEDGKRIAVINDFREGTREDVMADPMVGEVDGEDFVFVHPFYGEDVAAAKSMIEAFSANVKEPDCESVALFRREPDRLFLYSYGLVWKELPDGFTAPDGVGEDAYYLPLKRYLHRCPVCGRRTLPYRGEYMICGECGWEDEGIDDDGDEPYGANGDYTIKRYREEYLKRKSEDPEYQWYEEIKKRWGRSNNEK